MRIATWNVNSVRSRLDRILDVLQRHDLDVLALQEIKCKTEQFPREAFEAAGYEVAAHGHNQWNGVALISRIGLSEVRYEFPSQPGFEKGDPRAVPERAEFGFLDNGVPEARAIGAIVGGAKARNATAEPTTHTGLSLFDHFPAGSTSGNHAAPADELCTTSIKNSSNPPAHSAPQATTKEPRAGIEIWSLYVPNGRAINDPHYHYKLEFLSTLREYVESRDVGGRITLGDRCDKSASPRTLNARTLNVQPNSPHTSSLTTGSGSPANLHIPDSLHAHTPLLLVGDWNVIPTAADVWAPEEFEGQLYATQAERDAFLAFKQAGLREVTRPLVTNYTFWDYQKLHFPRNEGMRIDYMYASTQLADRARTAQIDRDERKGKGASDHVPVIVDFDL